MASDTSIASPANTAPLAAEPMGRAFAKPHPREDALVEPLPPLPLAAASRLSGPTFLHRFLRPYARHPRLWTDRQVLFVTLSFIALVYAGLYHPYWARGGDSELYLVIARNLVRGDGYTYNEQPVALVPPLWSLVLAVSFWFTSVVGILKLMMPVLFLVFLGCAYHVLRRIASPWIAAASIALTAILQGLVVLTLWFHSDALFFALSWVGLLLALQANEKHQLATAQPAAGPAPHLNGSWLLRAAGATLCLMAAVATRWPGVLWWPIIAMAFLNGRNLLAIQDRRFTITLWPKRLDGMWTWAILSGVMTAVTFFGLRWALRVDSADIDPRYDTFVTGHYDLINQHNRPTVGTHINRLLRAPEWLSVLYWNELGHTGKTALLASRLAAVTAIPLIAAGVVGLWRRQWIWLGVVGAWLPLVLTWPHAIDRYSGPVAPFLICGTILGTIWLSRWLDRRARAAADAEDASPARARRNYRLLPYAVMAVPLLVCLTYNISRYGLELWARLDYFPRYEGGVQPSINRISAYIRQNQSATGGEVGVTRSGVKWSSADEDEERYRKVRGVRRNLIFLTDTTAVDMPAHDLFSPTDPEFLDWASARGIRYFVVMPQQRRFFVHLRDLPPFYSDPVAAARNTDYILYELIGGESGLPVAVREVDASAWPQEILLIPGLEDVRRIGPKRRWLPIPYN